jgi:peptidoglycan/LPS O-acetylase OafA/YrhL
MDSIEGARGIAALSVALMHAANLMNVPHFSNHVGMAGVFSFGYVGVDFFFVLSGFIITYVHFADIGQAGSVPRYLWRRFSRIYPIYWTILILAIGTTALGRLALGKDPGIGLGVADIPSTVLLLMTGEPKFVGVAWTLQFEVMFYLSFCLLLVNARAGTAVFAAWAVAVLVQSSGMVDLKLPASLGNAHCLQFLLGVATGAAARRYQFGASHLALAAAVAALAVAAVLETWVLPGRHSALGRLMLGVASAALLAVLCGLERQRAIRTPGWLVFMGSTSYSIYLGHILFLVIAYAVLLRLGLYHRMPEWAVYCTGLASALAATMLIGRYVELPLVRALKDRWAGGVLTSA